jgi:HKD family nuclease
MDQSLNIDFITNTGSDNHLRLIKEQIEASREVWIAVAFLKQSGLKLLETPVKEAIARGTRFKVICGLDLYITEPEAIRMLQDWFQGQDENVLRLMPINNRRTFHSKVYCFHKRNGEVTLLVGSANLTCGGIKNNNEASMLVHSSRQSQIYEEVQEFFVDCERKSNPVTEIDLSQYTRQFNIHQRHIKGAEVGFAEEMHTITPLQQERILSLADAYNQDKRQQEDFQFRSDNYKKANHILMQMILEPVESEAAFLDYYELLVGKPGQRSLWHSDKLYRAKTMVANNYQTVLRMVNKLYEKIDQPIWEVFDIGKFYAVNIKGISVNVLTEILNTFSPNRFAVLNKRPLEILAYFGFEDFPDQNVFKPATYKRFVDLIAEIRDLCHFEDLGRVDHFLNYIYDKNHDRL